MSFETGVYANQFISEVTCVMSYWVIPVTHILVTKPFISLWTNAGVSFETGVYVNQFSSKVPCVMIH